MMPESRKHLAALFEDWSGESVRHISLLDAHGSDRTYCRIAGERQTAIGAHNADKKENRAFIEFTRHFHEAGLPVPELYRVDEANDVYLEEDLGDITLFALLTDLREKDGFNETIIELYKKAIAWLPKFQIDAGKTLNYRVCYPRASFDKQSMMWDLNYFKYYFLKLAKIPFDEQALEDDFEKFTRFLLQAEHDFFLYRDFQSRNIMIREGEPYFIDYQGGRKGALQYDVASLLYDAKADIPQNIRNQLLEHYIQVLSNHIPVEREIFLQHYYGYVFIRIMQALGAYGFRGFYERKRHFLRSVPYAIRNLEWLLQNVELPIKIPALTDAWERLVRSSYLRQIGNADLRLTVRIQSFSYRRGIPVDEKGHGGGFVFDCRVLPNPGRLPEYAQFTGNDSQIIEYLRKEPDVAAFMQHVQSIIAQVVPNYQKRNFTNLMVSFGCTGGRHRSVYCANLLADYLRQNFNVDVELRHRELELMEELA